MGKMMVILILVITLACVCVDRAYASWYQDVTHKLGRGLTNIVTAPIEAGNTIEYEIEKYDLFRGLSFGAVKGLVNLFGRLFVGAYEVLTFPIEYPADYRVILEPEFVFIGGRE